MTICQICSGVSLLVVARHPPIPGVLALIDDEKIAVGEGFEPGRVSPVVKVHVHIFSQKALPVAVLPAATIECQPDKYGRAERPRMQICKTNLFKLCEIYSLSFLGRAGKRCKRYVEAR